MATAFDELFADLGDTFDSLLKKPDSFLKPRIKLATQLKNTTKTLYDTLHSRETNDVKNRSTVLPELVVDGFDDEQIWQELEMQNVACSTFFVNSISRIYVATNSNIEKGNPSLLTLGKQPIEIDSCDDDSNLDQIANGEEYVSDEAMSVVDDDDDINKSLFDFGNDDDGSMSDDSIELERALDRKIEMDRLHDEGDDSKDEDENEEGPETNVKNNQKMDDEANSESDDDAQIEHPNLLERSDSHSRKKGLTKPDQAQPPGRKSVVDDRFFKLSEMENFLLLEDEKEMKSREGPKEGEDSDDSEEESVDFFKDVPSSHSDISDEEDEDQEGDKKNLLKSKYEDFFGNEEDSSDPMKMSDDDDNDEENADEAVKIQNSEVKSTFEIQQELLRNKIEELEESNLAEKPWQLKGETSAVDRPENSILQEHLQFDHLSRPAPVITEETTFNIEQIIKQRIKDQTWDNVERKVRPTENHFEYKKRIILDQEKSKLSLAEIYEQQYIKQQQGEKVEEEKEDAAHKLIRTHMDTLFAKLNALTNFHFVPKPPVPDVKIINNMPAITVEDVAPVGVSDAALLAPEEIKEKSKREVKSKEERSETDRLRERRTKKSKQKHIRKAKEARKKLVERFQPGLGNKYSKMEAMEQLKNTDKVDIKESKSKKKNESLKSSKSFFSKLQEEVQTSIQEKKAIKRSKDDANRMSIAKLKL